MLESRIEDEVAVNALEEPRMEELVLKAVDVGIRLEDLLVI